MFSAELTEQFILGGLVISLVIVGYGCCRNIKRWLAESDWYDVDGEHEAQRLIRVDPGPAFDEKEQSERQNKATAS